MDLKATLDIIIRDLDETREIIDDLKHYGDVPLLQIELAKSKCRSAAEMISLLKNLPENISKVQEPVLQEKPKVRSQVSAPRVVVTPKEPEKPQEVAPEPEKPVKTAGEGPMVADQFSGTPESFHEKLSGLKHEEEITDLLKSKPVSTLAEAIGINDKFLFIRELFNGSLESYNNAIDRLETAPDLTAAKEIVSSFTHAGEENEVMQQLMDLLKRKFPADE